MCDKYHWNYYGTYFNNIPIWCLFNKIFNLVRLKIVWLKTRKIGFFGTHMTIVLICREKIHNPELVRRPPSHCRCAPSLHWCCLTVTMFFCRSHPLPPTSHLPTSSTDLCFIWPARWPFIADATHARFIHRYRRPYLSWIIDGSVRHGSLPQPRSYAWKDPVIDPRWP